MEKMKLYVVGLGPGNLDEMTPRARKAIEESDVVAGYTLYMDMIAGLTCGKELIATPMKGEVNRCKAAIDAALSGKTVAVVSSGDAGVYGMASIVHELAADYPELEIEVIPGVTAACSAAALLGAPISHDFAVISLSDLLTDWDLIQKRVWLVAKANMVICLYNPSSKKRSDYLKIVCRIIMEFQKMSTPCGIVRNAGRDGESREIITLEKLSEAAVDMFSTVIIGNSETRIINGRLVTPRGYPI